MGNLVVSFACRCKHYFHLMMNLKKYPVFIIITYYSSVIITHFYQILRLLLVLDENTVLPIFTKLFNVPNDWYEKNQRHIQIQEKKVTYFQL